MATIVEMRVPASETLLETAFDRVPSLECELEQVIVGDGYGLWVSGPDHSEIDEALADDPTVTRYEQVTAGSNRWLYSIESTADVAALLDVIVDEGGVLLTATGADGQWTLRLRFLDRETISRVYDRLVDRGLTVDIDRIHNLQDDPAARIGLTDEQYEALSTAISYGYFKIPRNISLEELAAECGISHQAMSGRLRRAFEVLATTELDATSDSEGRVSE